MISRDMDMNAAMYRDIVTDCLMRHSAEGGISADGLKRELPDIPGDSIDGILQELLFGGNVEETDDGRLLMTSMF